MPVEQRRHVAPLLSGDETKYRRRYRVLKDMVNDLSDESNLLALRVHKIQRRIYDHYMDAYGRPPPPVPLPADASWSPLVGNKDEYPPDTGAPLANRAPKRSVGDADEASSTRRGQNEEDDDDDGDRSRAGTSVAGTSRAGTSVAGFHAKEEFQPPPDEWALDRERQARGVKRERDYDDEDEDEDEDYRMAAERESEARGASPRSDVDDY